MFTKITSNSYNETPIRDFDTVLYTCDQPDMENIVFQMK